MRAILFAIVLFSAVGFAQDDDLPPLPPMGVRAEEPGKSKVKARVFYEDTGRPVKRTSVMLVTADQRERQASGLTDGAGMLEIKNLKAGKYYAIVNAPGVASPLAYLDSRRNEASEISNALAGFSAIIVDGLTDVVTEIAARRGGAIGGRVTYADGDPAIGVRVEILRKIENGDFIAPIPNMSAITSMITGGVGTYQTDDRGVYRFSGLPAGEYIVKVVENVVHTRGERVRLPYEDFENLFAGNQSSMLSVFFDNVFEKDKATKIELQFGQDLGEVNIVIPDRSLHSLDGKVVAAKDKLPIRGARVSIKRDGDTDARPMYTPTNQGVATDDEGKFSFGELPKGKYIITVESTEAVFDEKDRAYGPDPKDSMAANGANMTANIPWNARGVDRPAEKPAKFTAAKKEITIDENDLADQSIEMSFGATITGTVTVEGSKGSPGTVNIISTSESLGGATATVYFYEDGDSRSRGEQKKDFRLEAIPGGLNSVFISVGDKNYYVKTAASSQLDLLKGDVTVKEGELYANVRIVLSNETGTLKGTLIDGDKQPVRGFELNLIPTDAAKQRVSTYYRTVRTDEKGEFQIKLPPFEYAVMKLPTDLNSAKREEFFQKLAAIIKRSQTVKIDAGQTSSVKLSSDKLLTATK